MARVSFDLKKTVKANSNVHIDLTIIYICFYHVCLFFHNLLITKLLNGVSGSPKPDFLVIKKTPQNPMQNLILIVKSFSNVKGIKRTDMTNIICKRSALV